MDGIFAVAKEKFEKSEISFLRLDVMG